MPGSVYLQPSEYAEFDLPSTVNPALVLQAGSLIDGHLKRRGGCIWSPDATGLPAYMPALPTSLRLASASAISPGTGVVVSYDGPTLDNNWVGEVVILDRDDEDAVEAVVIQAINSSPKSIQFYTVQFAHGADCTMEFGLTCCEQKDLPNNRPITMLSEWPVMKLLSGAGRYGYGRRSSQVYGNYQDFNLLATVSSFGGPPMWTTWNVDNASVNMNTGEIWVPAGVLLAYFTNVKIWYVAGWKREDLPYDIKRACANLVNILKETGLGANIRRREQTTGTAVSKFENTLIDFDTRTLLQRYHARTYG